MSKTFRAWKIDEPLLLPPMVEDFVARGHLARFVLNLVRDDIDLAEITGTYGSERGQPPFDPTMMTALLLYSYCCGIYSSRRIATACCERVDFMSIVALDAPDFRTISDFRKRHLKALGKLFGQILQLCETAGLVKLGHVALDGTKIKANASKHKAMSYERMKKRAAELEAEVAKWLGAAEAADAAEDKLRGCDKTGDEMPEWVADKKRRAEKIRQAKAELEAEAKAAAEAKLKAAAEAQEKRESKGRRKGGRKAAPPSTEPDAKAQKNFTDPESRIMKSKDGFVQAYNAQAAVDGEAQIIVAHDVTQSGVDCGQLIPMIDAIETNLGRKPEQLSADAGYCSEANLEALENRNIDAYVATGRARDAVAGAVKGEAAAAPALEPADVPTRVEAMRAKIKAGGHASPYRLRKQLPEPVFGQIKQARGFRQFLLRGFEKVRAEWAVVCTAHNLLKLEQSPIRLTIARICQVCGAFSSRDLIETRGDSLAKAADGECAVLERI
jgi:transposase